MPRNNSRAKQDQRKDSAKKRLVARAERTADDQIAVLDARAPRGAKRERARLLRTHVGGA